MYFKFRFPKLLLICSILGCCVHDQEVKACPGKPPVDMLVLLDGTNNMTPDLKDLQTTILTKVISNLPEGSKASLVLVGETSSDIVLYKQVEGVNIDQSLKSIGRMPALGNVISGPFLQTEIPTYFMDSPLTNNRAEIVILMTSNNVDGFSVDVVETLRKRKTYVIGLGTKTLPDNIKEIAANEDHVGFVMEPDDVEDLVNAFRDLICTDSTYLCDTDNFKLHNWKRCHPCSETCSSTIQARSASCKNKCPYYRAIQFIPTTKYFSTTKYFPTTKFFPTTTPGDKKSSSPSDEDPSTYTPNLTNDITDGNDIAKLIGLSAGSVAFVLLIVIGIAACKYNLFSLISERTKRCCDTRPNMAPVQEQVQMQELLEIRVDGGVPNDEDTDVDSVLLQTTEAANEEPNWTPNDRPVQVVQEGNDQAMGDGSVDEGFVALEQVEKNRQVFDPTMIDLATEDRLKSLRSTIVGNDVRNFAENQITTHMSTDNEDGELIIFQQRWQDRYRPNYS